MTADEFIHWAMQQPDGQHYELADGVVVAMAPERVEHARAMAAAWLALRSAIAQAGLPCEAFPDGMAVRVDEATVFEPDAAVRCGAPLRGDVVSYDDPVIVVEVLSPSTSTHDRGGKLEGYFRVAALRHYLLVKTDTRSVIHHARDAEGRIATAILRDGMLRLDPPGIEVAVAGIAGGASPEG